MSASKISRFLPNNEYLAAVNASAPTAVNPFATIADIPTVVGLQGVMDVGATYTGSATININTTDDASIFAGEAGLILSSAGYIVLGYGSGTTAGIAMGPAVGDGVQVRDETASSGMYYLAPYSTQGIILHGDRWIPDAGWVNSQITAIPTPTLQSTMDVGSSATVATPINIISSASSLSFKYDNGVAINGYYANSGSTYFSANDGAGSLLFNLSTATGAFFSDSKFSRGLKYNADYSLNGFAAYGDRWIPDAGWVNSQIALVSDLNGIYTGSGSLSGATTVTMGANNLTFGNDTADIGIVRFGSGGVNTLGEFAVERISYSAVRSRVLVGRKSSSTDIMWQLDNYLTGARLALKSENALQGMLLSAVIGGASSMTNPLTVGQNVDLASANTAGLVLYALNTSGNLVGMNGAVASEKVVYRLGSQASSGDEGSRGALNLYYGVDGSIKSHITASATEANYLKQRLGLGFDSTTLAGINASSILHTKGGDVKFEGLTGSDVFNFTHATGNVGIGQASDADYRLIIQDSASYVGGLRVNSSAVNGQGAYINKTGSGGVAMTVRNTFAGGDALSIPNGNIISNSNATELLFVSTLSAPSANGRFKVGIAGGNFTTAYTAVLRNVATGQENVGFDTDSGTGASLNAEWIGLRAGSSTGIATNTYGTKVSLGTNSAGSITNTFGHYFNWTGSTNNNPITINGTHRAFYADMRSPYASDTITGDVYGIDLYLGAGVSTTIHSGNIIGQRIKSVDAGGSTTTKTVGLEIDLAGSLSTTIYGMTVLGGNSGFGVLAPASMVTVSGDVETVVAGDGLIVLDASNGTRYRIYMDGGVLSSQLA